MQSGLVLWGDLEAVLNDEHVGVKIQISTGLVGAVNFPLMINAGVALLVEKSQHIGSGCALGHGDREGYHGCFTFLLLLAPCGNGVSGIGFDELTSAGIVGTGKVGKEDFKIVVELGQGSDRGASGAYSVFLFDGNRRGDALNAINRGFVHAVEKLTDVG